MRRFLAAVLAAFLLLSWTLPALADVGGTGGGYQTWYDLKLIDPNSPEKGFIMKEANTPGSKGKMRITTSSIITEDGYAYITKIAQAAGVNNFQVEGETGGGWTRLMQGARMLGKTPQMYMDVAKALDNVMAEGMINLNDPQKRYEFWKQVGIYDKYTPNEIRYINKYVFPTVAIGKGFKTLGCAAISGATLGFTASGGNPAVAVAAAAGNVIYKTGAIAFKAARDKGLKFEASINTETGARPVGLSPDKNDPSLEVDETYDRNDTVSLTNVSASLKIYMDPKRGGDIAPVGEDSLFSALNIVNSVVLGLGNVASAALNANEIAARELRNTPEVARLRELTSTHEVRVVNGELVAFRNGLRAEAATAEIRSLLRAIKAMKAFNVLKTLAIGLVGGYCEEVAVRGSYELVGLINAWGIPEPTGGPGPVVVVEKYYYHPEKSQEAQDYKLIYGLRR